MSHKLIDVYYLCNIIYIYIEYTLHGMKFIVQAPNSKGGALGISIPLRDSSANGGTAGLQNT